jgi:hypothetical protein
MPKPILIKKIEPACITVSMLLDLIMKGKLAKIVTLTLLRG